MPRNYTSRTDAFAGALIIILLSTVYTSVVTALVLWPAQTVLAAAVGWLATPLLRRASSTISGSCDR